MYQNKNEKLNIHYIYAYTYILYKMFNIPYLYTSKTHNKEKLLVLLVCFYGLSCYLRLRLL